MTCKFSRSEIVEALRDPIFGTLFSMELGAGSVERARVARALVCLAVEVLADGAADRREIVGQVNRAIHNELHRRRQEKFRIGRMFGALPQAQA